MHGVDQRTHSNYNYTRAWSRLTTAFFLGRYCFSHPGDRFLLVTLSDSECFILVFTCSDFHLYISYFHDLFYFDTSLRVANNSSDEPLQGHIVSYYYSIYFNRIHTLSQFHFSFSFISSTYLKLFLCFITSAFTILSAFFLCLSPTLRIFHNQSYVLPLILRP